MTLASHARGPEFEPRCEYFHFFFRRKKNIEQQNQKSRGKYSFLPLHHAHLSHCLLLIQEALIMIQACIMCLPRIDWVSGSFAYKFFQNWLRVLTLASVRSTLTLFRRRCYGFWTFYANKKKFKTTTKTCLKMWLVNKKKVGLVMAPKHLAAPGDSARPGPRSWSASKPGAWPMDVAQTIQLISFVTM